MAKATSSTSGSGTAGAKKPKKRDWWILTVPLAAICVIFLIRLLSPSGEGPQETVRAAQSPPSQIVQSANGTTAAAPASLVYEAQLPEGGIVSIPAADDGALSQAVHVPAGFTICRDAELGRGSFRTEYQGLGGGTWQSLPDGNARQGIAERYVSRTTAQSLSYRFVPAGQPC